MTLRDIISFISNLISLVRTWFVESKQVAKRQVSWMDSPIQNVIGAICIYLVFGFVLFVMVGTILAIVLDIIA
jgi:hypothetical protein